MRLLALLCVAQIAACSGTSTATSVPPADAAASKQMGATSTTGELGRVKYRIYSSQCLSGCDLDRPVLEGGMVTVTLATADGRSEPASARLVPGELGALTANPRRCTTTAGTTSCTLPVDIETVASGAAVLEALDTAGRVLDRAALHVAPAKTLRVSATGDEAAPNGVARSFALLTVNGGFIVPKRATRVHLATTVLADDGREMVWTQHGLAITYADPAILHADDSAAYGFGRTDVEDIAPAGAGETTVTVRARGAELPVRFYVSR